MVFDTSDLKRCPLAGCALEALHWIPHFTGMGHFWSYSK
uniref:Uncharacterized protein n=1 Tax=Arundo donax TaxID=35708 RepID=A0A0A9HEB3_ARUDO